jgi:LacI family transcriptional regulator
MSALGDSSSGSVRRATLADVAAAAGVHTSLVSRVLRDDPRGFASAQTRARILQAAKDLGYRPNASAQGLRSSRTMTLGLLLPGFTSPLYSAIARGVEETAAANGYGLVLGTHAAGDPHETITNMLMHGRVDAMLVASGRIEDNALRQLASRAPSRVVLVNRQVRGVNASVILRDSDAADVAVRHLIDLGHTHIGGVFGPPTLDTMVRRMKGFRNALKSAGLNPVTAVEQGRDYHAGYHGACKLMSATRPPSALVTATFPMGIGALAAMRDLGRRVPDQVSIITIHNDQLADFLTPALTAVALPAAELGTQAVRLALDMARGGRPRRVVVPDEPRLVPRSSTGPPPSSE